MGLELFLKFLTTGLQQFHVREAIRFHFFAHVEGITRGPLVCMPAKKFGFFLVRHTLRVVVFCVRYHTDIALIVGRVKQAREEPFTLFGQSKGSGKR